MKTKLPVAAAVLAFSVSLLATGFGSGAGAAAVTKDPKNAGQLGALLTAKKLGCHDFAPETFTGTTPTSSTVPAALQALFALVGKASVGSCSVGADQTILVVFRDSATRKRLESGLAALPCPIVTAVLGRLTTPTTGGAPSATKVKLPLVEVGTRGLVISTGTAPDTDRLDLGAAASADKTIASRTKGKLRTISYSC